MREIKFRAWHYENREMIPSSSLTFHEYSPLEDQLDSDGKTMDFMQYTGMKDRNGVEIYEGDIVKVVSNGYSNYISFDGANCTIEYYDKICAFIGKRYKNTFFEISEYFQLDTRAEIEVIGNIYENHDLLEAK